MFICSKGHLYYWQYNTKKASLNSFISPNSNWPIILPPASRPHFVHRGRASLLILGLLAISYASDKQQDFARHKTMKISLRSITYYSCLTFHSITATIRYCNTASFCNYHLENILSKANSRDFWQKENFSPMFAWNIKITDAFPSLKVCDQDATQS